MAAAPVALVLSAAHPFQTITGNQLPFPISWQKKISNSRAFDSIYKCVIFFLNGPCSLILLPPHALIFLKGWGSSINTHTLRFIYVVPQANIFILANPKQFYIYTLDLVSRGWLCTLSTTAPRQRPRRADQTHRPQTPCSRVHPLKGGAARLHAHCPC